MDTITVNQSARVKDGEHEATMGNVIMADLAQRKVWLDIGNGHVLQVGWENVEQFM